jgi:hypothetical protein
LRAYDLLEVDLCDLSHLSQFNRDVTFLLVAIDTFSKFCWVSPLKNKSAKTICAAFGKILKSVSRPIKTINSDRGSEWINKEFKRLLAHHNIKQNFNMTASKFKCAIVERQIRTLKEKIFKYLTYRKSKKYIDFLPQIVTNYNNTVHSVTRFKPIDASDEKNQLQVYENIRKRYRHRRLDHGDQGGDQIQKKNSSLQENSLVRVAINKHVFEKGYTPIWSREIFKIKKVIYKRPFAVYVLEDLHGKQVTLRAYQHQLQKVNYENFDIILSKSNLYKPPKFLVYRNHQRMWLVKEQLRKNLIENK